MPVYGLIWPGRSRIQLRSSLQGSCRATDTHCPCKGLAVVQLEERGMTRVAALPRRPPLGAFNHAHILLSIKYAQGEPERWAVPGEADVVAPAAGGARHGG
jgi:hypothetical protein